MSTTGKFIVVFKEDATQEQIDQYVNRVNQSGGEVISRYDSVLKGFAANLTEQSLTSFQGDDLIDYVEPDGVITTQQQ